LDDHSASVDDQEAETEAWAELIYGAFMSEGSKSRMTKWVHDQSSWICAQNKEVAKHLRQPMDFPWRYTIGKQAVWERWGILSEESVASLPRVTSLRLTMPPSAAQKRHWGVRLTSTAL
jgi:hypothetical protein